MNHLHDLAKDHLFLETFQVEEERAHEENLWYGEVRILQRGEKKRLA